MNDFTFKKLIITLFVLVICIGVHGQFKTYDKNGSPRATTSERIGITDIQINYGRPGVKGRDGKIWGDLVQLGFVDFHYGTSKAAPWRAGANENTTIEFSTDVYVENKLLPAGKYGFFIAMGLEKATIVFSKFNTAWGSFYYNPKDDALRAEVPVLKMKESTERLQYEFSDETDSTAIVSLRWEKIKIPFKIVIDLKKEQIAEFRRAVNAGEFYVYWQNMQSAANYCLINDVNLDEGLQWARRSISDYFGEENFVTLSTYGGLLEKTGNKKSADSIMTIALPKASKLQLGSYGNNLLQRKKTKEAFDVFKMNYDKYPGDIGAIFGMMRGFYAVGKKSESLKLAEKLYQMETGSDLKAYLRKWIDDIKTGKEIIN